MLDQQKDTKVVEQPLLTQATSEQKMVRNIAYDIVVDKKIDFTHAMASKLLEMPEFVGERALRDSHVDYLVQCAKNGTFLLSEASVSTCYCMWDGVERRLNGQHTAWMRTYMPEDWKCPIQWIKYRVATEDEFRKLYSSIDRGAPRTRSHITNARLVGTREFEGVPSQAIGQMQQGLRLWIYGGRTKAEFNYVSIDTLATLMQSKYLGLCLKVAGLMKMIKINNIPGAAHMKRSSVVAAMFATLEKHEKQARDFWMAVASGLDLSVTTDPRYKLRDYLQRFSVNSGAGARTGKTIVTMEDMYRCCIQAWNAHRDDTQIQVLRPAPQRRPSAK